MTLIDKNRLMAFIADEAAERLAFMKHDDAPAKRLADLAFLAGLEAVGTYVEEIARPVEVDRAA